MALTTKNSQMCVDNQVDSLCKIMEVSVKED
jgi:hypothetical protein